MIIPLSHYSRNAPRIHNVGHFFQIAKVPSCFCKFRPAFVLDSVTFVAIAKRSQMHLRVGNLFHFPQNSWVHWEPNTTNIRVYEYDTMKQERKTTLVPTFLRIYCDMVENKRNARRIMRPIHECNTILTNQRRISWQCGQIYVIGQLCRIQYDTVRIATTVERCIWELIVPYHTNVSGIYCELKVFTTTTMCTTFIKHNKTIS